MAQYSKIVEGYLTVTTGGTAQFVNLPMVPNTFETWNKSVWGEAPVGTATVQYAIGFVEDAAGTYYGNSAISSSSAAAIKNVTASSNGFSFINAGTYQYGPTLTITGIVAATGIVTTSGNHNLSIGDAVLIYGTTGMLQIAGTMTSVTAVGSPTTFTIGNIPTAGFAANATAGFAKKVLYPDLYIPYGSIITAISTGATTTITTSLNHNFVVGQEVFFVVPNAGVTNTNPVWGTTQLDTLGYLTANGVPQQAYVTVVPNTHQITVNVNSTGYGAFTYPTSAQAALGITFPQVLAIGDQNSGTSQVPPVNPPITIPGAFYANTRQGVLIGSAIAANTGNVLRYRAVFPDLVKTTSP